ncbi:hypothetical protein ACHAWC_007977 [Mediolabrus comicus]
MAHCISPEPTEAAKLSNQDEKLIISVDQLMNYVETLLDLIHNRQWDELEECAEQRALFKMISEHIQQSEEFNGMTLLHAVIKYNPPIQVLESMIQAHSDAIRGQDCLGRTPLHVACGTGSDSSIIRMLARAYPEACDVQDVDGRTPLHLACDYECVLFEGDQTPKSPPSIGVVRALLSGSLKPVLIEDEDEMSPIEYALVSEADMEVIKLLQLASMTLRRRIAKVDKQIAALNRSNNFYTNHSSYNIISEDLRRVAYWIGKKTR